MLIIPQNRQDYSNQNSSAPIEQKVLKSKKKVIPLSNFLLNMQLPNHDEETYTPSVIIWAILEKLQIKDPKVFQTNYNLFYGQYKFDAFLGPMLVPLDMLRYQIMLLVIFYVDNPFWACLILVILLFIYWVLLVISRPHLSLKITIDCIIIEFLTMISLVGIFIITYLDHIAIENKILECFLEMYFLFLASSDFNFGSLFG